MGTTSSLTIRPEPGSMALIGSGQLLDQKNYVDGKETGPKMRDGRPIRRAPGVTAVMSGTVLDGFTVTTTSADLNEVPEGSLLAVSGAVEVIVRGEARAGFGDSGPRATLTGTVFVEHIEPVGNVANLLAQAARRNGKES